MQLTQSGRIDLVLLLAVNHFRGRIRDPSAPTEPNGEAEVGSGAPPKKKGNSAAADEQVLKLGNER